MSLTKETLYDFLAEDEDTRTCKDISDQACQVVPGNFVLIFISQIMTKLGDALANAKTVLPWLLTSMGAPAFMVGLLVPIRESGSLIPQLFVGGMVRTYALRKWFYVAGCLVQGFALLLIAYVGLNNTGSSGGYWVLGLLVVFSIARAFCSVSSKDVLGKTVPKTRRGRLGGVSASAAGLLTVATGVAMLLGWDDHHRSPVFLLALASVFWMLAAAIFAQVNEFKGATDGASNAAKKAFASLSLLKTDRLFRRFVTVRCLLMSSGLVAPYIVVMAQQSNNTDLVLSLGLFITASGIASLISGTLWGKFADRDSRKVLIVSAALCGLICLLGACLQGLESASEPWAGVLLFFCLSVVHQGVRLGRKTYLIDVATGNLRTEYVAVSNAVIGLMLLGVGLFGAVLAQFSLVYVLAFFAVASSLGSALALSLKKL